MAVSTHCPSDNHSACQPQTWLLGARSAVLQKKATSDAPVRDSKSQVRQAGGCRWVLAACCTCHTLPAARPQQWHHGVCSFELSQMFLWDSAGTARCSRRWLRVGETPVRLFTVPGGGVGGEGLCMLFRKASFCRTAPNVKWRPYAEQGIGHLAHSSRSRPDGMLSSCASAPDHRQPPLIIVCTLHAACFHR